MKEMFLDLAKYRIQRAYEQHGDAGLLLRSQHWAEAVNRVYQANFYAIKALLATKMRDASKHQQVLQAFNELFIVSGEIPARYGQIVDRSHRGRDTGERHEALQVSPEDAATMLQDSESFLGFVRDYLKHLAATQPRRSEQPREQEGGGRREERHEGRRGEGRREERRSEGQPREERREEKPEEKREEQRVEQGGGQRPESSAEKAQPTAPREGSRPGRHRRRR